MVVNSIKHFGDLIDDEFKIAVDVKGLEVGLHMLGCIWFSGPGSCTLDALSEHQERQSP
jgi:hypothetical protein